jgi:hypothetical protein
MDDPALAFILEEALALLDAGEDAESIVARFPDFSDKLAPLLQLAGTLKETADDAIEVPIDFLEDLGDFLQNRLQDLTDQ